MGPGNRTHYWPIRCRWRISYHSCISIICKTSIGTSLVIIAINSIFGFLFSLKQTTLDWKLLLLFTGLAIIGIYLGSLSAEKISSRILKKTFGWFVLLMAIYILIKELFLK